MPEQVQGVPIALLHDNLQKWYLLTVRRQEDAKNPQEWASRVARVKKESAGTKILLTLGGIGLTIHLLFLHWSALHGATDASGSFVNNFFVNASMGLLGGLFYALFLRYPVIESIRDRKISLFVLFKGGVLGAVATSLAFQGLYLGAACILTYKMEVAVPEGGLKMAFLLAIMEIETYGLIVMFYFLIPAFACGALVTAVVARSSYQAGGPGLMTEQARGAPSHYSTLTCRSGILSPCAARKKGKIRRSGPPAPSG